MPVRKKQQLGSARGLYKFYTSSIQVHWHCAAMQCMASVGVRRMRGCLKGVKVVCQMPSLPQEALMAQGKLASSAQDDEATLRQ